MLSIVIDGPTWLHADLPQTPNIPSILDWVESMPNPDHTDLALVDECVFDVLYCTLFSVHMCHDSGHGHIDLGSDLLHHNHTLSRNDNDNNNKFPYPSTLHPSICHLPPLALLGVLSGPSLGSTALGL